MKRTTCAACGHPELDQFLDLGQSPIADAYTATADEESPIFPLQVAVCAKCKLVQLLEVVPAEALFGTGYSFYSSASAPLSAYHRAYADDVMARHGDLVTRRGVVEVGCNDGDLLRHFQHVRHLGVDPSTGPAAAAIERGCVVLPEPFGLLAAEQIRSIDSTFGVVIANHVLAHVEDVSDCLAGIAHLLHGGGVAIVEVQYLPDLLVNNAFDLVYHEHRNFFSLSNLEQAAQRHGLYVMNAELTNRQGGSLRVTLSPSHHFAAQPSRVTVLRASEGWLDSLSAYEGMQGRAERIRTRLLDLLAQHDQVAAYGAPAKLTTLLSFCGLDASTIRWCVDTTEAKQGRFIPGAGIPIVAPGTSERPDAYLLAAHNYLGPIVSANPGNRWIVPFPAPVIL